jgi:hypothetical protein
MGACGVSKPARGLRPAAISVTKPAGHDRDVSLRLLSLILDRHLSRLMLLAHTSSTKDVELLVLRHE